MSKKVFTKGEIKMLRGNPYTYAVSPHILSFTKEFKELFWAEYQDGTIPRQILERHGYPPEVLGKERIWGIANAIKRQYNSPDGIHEGALPKRSQASGDSCRTTEEHIIKLQGEVQYLRQEIEFLKKIFSARTIRK